MDNNLNIIKVVKITRYIRFAINGKWYKDSVNYTKNNVDNFQVLYDFINKNKKYNNGAKLSKLINNSFTFKNNLEKTTYELVEITIDWELIEKANKEKQLVKDLGTCAFKSFQEYSNCKNSRIEWELKLFLNQ